MVETVTNGKTAVEKKVFRAVKRSTVQANTKYARRCQKKGDKLERIQRSEEAMKKHGTLSAWRFLDFFLGRTGL